MAITDSTALVMDRTSDTEDQYDPAHDFHSLNAMLNLYDATATSSSTRTSRPSAST
jgi:ribonucleoside-diphosphate reductase alpha chain